MSEASLKSAKYHCDALHLINTEGQNGSYAAATGLKSLAGELGITHEALYRTLAALEKAKVIRREDGVLSLVRASATPTTRCLQQLLVR